MWYSRHYLQSLHLTEVAGDEAILINTYNTEEITEAIQAILTDSSSKNQVEELSTRLWQHLPTHLQGKADEMPTSQEVVFIFYLKVPKKETFINIISFSE